MSPVQIGFIATMSLLGTAVLTLVVGLIAPRHDLRNMLLLGAGLMAFTGIALPRLRIPDFHRRGGLRRHHQSFHRRHRRAGAAGACRCWRGTRPDADRTRIFARYSLIGALSIAAGALAAGARTCWCRSGWAGRPLQEMFYLYAALGRRRLGLPAPAAREGRGNGTPAAALGPSRRTVYKLAALFSLDAFAGGFTVQSLLALWLFERFDISVAAASPFFFWSNVLTAFSYPVAARLAARASVSSTPWSSRTFPRASALSWRRSPPTSPSRSRSSSCGRRSRRWTCRRGRPT